MWTEGLDLNKGGVINKEVAKNGFDCLFQPYLNIRQNDRIIILLDGIPVEHVVSPDEAKSLKPIRVHIDKATIQQLPKNGEVLLRFTVIDVVGNTPAGKYKYSKPIKFISELNPDLLQFPLVQLGDDPLDQIDLDSLKQDANLNIKVTLKGYEKAPKPPHKVYVTLVATHQKKDPITIELPVVIDRNRHSELVPLPQEYVSNLADWNLRVSFVVKSDAGELLGTSGSTSVSVVGTATLMEAPNIIPCEAGLSPAKTELTGVIPSYEPHNPDHLEIFYVESARADGSGQRISLNQLAGPQGGTRRLTAQALSVFEGRGPLHAYYETINEDQTPTVIRQSKRMTFEIGERIPTLPRIYLADAVDDNIDPNTLAYDSTSMYIPVASTVNGDRVEWSVTGKDKRSSTSGVIKITKSLEGPGLPKLEIPLDVKIITDNLNGSLLCTYSVIKAGQPPKVLRSELYEVTIGLPVVLTSLEVLEANPKERTLAPKDVINGATVEMKYSTARATDRIAFKWKGQYDVSLYETVVSADPKAKSVKITIPADVIAKGIRQDGNNIEITCKIMRGKFHYEFAPLKVRLLALKSLPAPRISGQENTTVLPVDLLDVSARILVAIWEFMRVGQHMWLECSGTFADGTPYTENIFTANEVTTDNLTKGVALSLPVDKVRNLQDGSHFEIKFWVSFPGLPVLHTATLFNTASFIIQQLPASLPHPTLNGVSSTAQETTVDPLTIQNNTSVTVKYQGMLATDIIPLCWVFENGTQYQTTLKGQASGSVVFDMTAAQVLHNSVNSRVQLKYSVVRGAKITQSNVQTITVGTIAQANLPRALINGLASGTALVLNSIKGNATAALAIWPLIKAGQRVWLNLGTDGGELKVLEGYPITAIEARQGLSGLPVSRDWIAGVPHNKAVTVKVWVAFDGTDNRQASVEFPTTTHTANTLVNPPVITIGIVASSGRGVYNGGSTTAAEGLATEIHGTCDARPFARGLRIGPYAGGGYGISIPAGTTTWKCWTLWYTWNPQDIYVVDSSQNYTVYSAPFRIYRR
ncbi:hypothetical protein [Pseudomonas sp. D2002]|uniref:hypothetical protein n=1 Tax=Pseudomonas sp. D2002 TaxID=2726980 RepID=UPI0015A32493|nr:hypothetical protein [Pseudomonas sp. D2002]NWA81406.1 hypothetical protein [Pseudomonas sp. D2002]